MYLYQMISDRLFKFGAYEAIQLQSKYSPSFFYHFAYKSVFGVGEIMGNTTDYLGKFLILRLPYLHPEQF